MTEKMTYEKLFNALKEGKKITGTHKEWGDDGFIKLNEAGCVVDEAGEYWGYAFLDYLFDNEYENFKIIEEEKPYDMTYREALMYMLEKPGLHCVSASFNPEESIYLHPKYLYFMGDKINDYKDTGLRNVTEDFYDGKWRKEPDLVCDESGTDTDVATKNEKLESIQEMQKEMAKGHVLCCDLSTEEGKKAYQQALASQMSKYRIYKKGDKLLMPAEVFKALLAGEKVRRNYWAKYVSLAMREGHVVRNGSIQSDFDYESDENYWWEVAE